MLMRCISQMNRVKLLSDIHGRVCEAHHSYKALAGKAFRQGEWRTSSIRFGHMELVLIFEPGE